MKFGQLIEHNKKITLFKNHAENEVGRFQTSFYFLKKIYMR